MKFCLLVALATSQVLSGHPWLVASLLDKADRTFLLLQMVLMDITALEHVPWEYL